MKITGSSLPLLSKCSWWARDEVIAPPPQPPSEAMQLGTEVHAAIEATLRGTPVAKLDGDAADIYVQWKTWFAKSPLCAESWEPEVAFAYNVARDTARRINVTGRQYEVDAGEIAGTIDALALNEEHAIVVDWKTSTGYGFHGLADAADNWQLKAYALMVARTHGLQSVKILVVRITPDWVQTSEATLDALDLDAIASTIATRVAAISTSVPQPGSHCQRCRAVSACPTTQTATEAIVAAPADSKLITSPDQASALLVRLRQVQAACEQMEAMLKAYAANQGEAGIPLGNGKRWVKTSVERESINLNGPENALGIAAISMAGAEAAIETKLNVSKAAIERIFKANGLKGKELRDKIEGLMSELRAAGVTRSTTVDAYREVE